MDKIKIRDLEVFAYHGVFPEENAQGQSFFVNATLYTNTRNAGLQDDLTLSTNYGEVCHLITECMQKYTYQLIETVAENVAREILLQFPLVQKLDLEIKKPDAPIGLPFGYVSVEVHRGWHQVYLSIGSNLGDKKGYLDFAVEELGKLSQVRNIKLSDLIETEPYGGVEQDSFINGAIALETLFPPEELLDALHVIEAAGGRERLVHWGPRTLDLDIVFYDDLVMDSESLIIPHIDMQNRRFVLEPLVKLCPGKVHPVLKKTVQQMLKEVQES